MLWTGEKSVVSRRRDVMKREKVKEEKEIDSREGISDAAEGRRLQHRGGKSMT